MLASFCGNCGRPFQPNETFCAKCGTLRDANVSDTTTLFVMEASRQKLQTAFTYHADMTRRMHFPHVVWSPNSRRIAITTDDSRSISILNTLGHTEQKLKIGWGVRDLTWSPDGKSIAYSNGSSRDIGIVNVSSGRFMQAFTLKPDYDPSQLQWSPDGEIIYCILSQSDSQGICAYSIRQEKILWESQLFDPWLLTYRLSPDGTKVGYVAVQQIAICSAATGELLSEWKVPRVESLTWSLDSEKLIVNGVLLPKNKGKFPRWIAKELVVDDSYIIDALLPDNTHAAVHWVIESRYLWPLRRDFTGKIKYIKTRWKYEYGIINVSSRKEVAILENLDDAITVLWSPDCKYVAAVTEKGKIQVFFAPRVPME